MDPGSRTTRSESVSTPVALPVHASSALDVPGGAPATGAPGIHPPAPRSDPFGEQRRSLRKRLGSVLAGLLAIGLKFASGLKALLVALPNLKLLTTTGTALVSVAAYSLFWGWTFALGFVLLLFIHEMGHVIQLRREGVPASAPMFIPFLGAVVAARSLGENALAEARVGLAGPVLGSVGAAAGLAIGEAADSNFFRALAYVGFLLNLFNLIPVVPLDGGRAMAAMAPWMWFVGYAGVIALVILTPNPILILILVFGGFELWRRWQARKTRSLEQAAYYRVSPRARIAVATVYVGLIVLLAVGMDIAYITRTIS
ncbi:MAG TPA: site-2 protease family protein [Solirubrobacteraceae bacterium]|nr:site-2 protease family protein [Solirubrobacteraceae bacterium]